MKKFFEPEIEVVSFSVEDVITNSNSDLTLDEDEGDTDLH